MAPLFICQPNIKVGVGLEHLEWPTCGQGASCRGWCGVWVGSSALGVGSAWRSLGVIWWSLGSGDQGSHWVQDALGGGPWICALGAHVYSGSSPTAWIWVAGDGGRWAPWCPCLPGRTAVLSAVALGKHTFILSFFKHINILIPSG